MPIANEIRDGSLHILLEGSMTADRMVEIRTELLGFLKTADRITIHTEKVDDCDTLGVQLLLSLGRSACKGERGIVIGEISQSIRDAALRCGIDPSSFVTAETVG